MISLKTINGKIQYYLSLTASGNLYKIYADSELHKKPTRKGNSTTKYIEGVSTVVNSTIVPIQGLQVGTQTIAIEFAIPIDTRDMVDTTIGIESIVQSYIRDINNVVAYPRIENDMDGYVVTITGTMAEVGEPSQEPSIGLMIPISFTITLNYFENGLNSLNQKLYFVKDGVKNDILFTSISIGRNVIQDGGAVSNSNGIAKNYVQTTALSIELNIPSTKESVFCSEFREFIRSGISKKLDIVYSDDGVETSYSMLFLTSNLQAQGVDNVGYTITLAEAL